MQTETQDDIRKIWRALSPEIEAMFSTMWHMPELPGMEYRSMQALSEWMESHGLTVERGVGGVPTAFRARVRNGDGPKIGILVEYDALPSLNNDAVPYRQGNRRLPGHGCGHNHIGPANTGAGIAAAKALLQLDLQGEIVIIGCPAEEIGWGKLALQAAGVFDELDTVLTSHGDYQNGSLARPCHAIASGEFRFTGESAHGGKVAGKNALETAETAFAAFDRLRLETFPGLQLKHVYRAAGITPGVTPEEVRLWSSVRHHDFDTVIEGYRLMTETYRSICEQRGVEFYPQPIAACRGYLGNDTVGRLLADCLTEIGPPRWTEQDIAWMEQLSAACDPGNPFNLPRELEYFDTGIDYYGQDDGDISWQIPLGRVNWAYPSNVPIHHWAWTALSGHKSSSPGPLMASEALTLGALVLVMSPATVEKAKIELKQRTGEKLIPPPNPTITDIIVTDPAGFWDATWTRESPVGHVA
ncbi:amidohydrolase [Mesorhizobium sp. DCY119]|uniref:amidohydrolase n=1 Tax=Mesorhizobium sp. DCY119 TaxID=2108445 RepID=UPI000E722EB2|nr:amidohydrolase [Mesorhizobium sp. DCY119]RJG39879.1 amidohydrolase [Mesorhizobium sp. DCY119]